LDILGAHILVLGFVIKNGCDTVSPRMCQRDVLDYYTSVITEVPKDISSECRP
jgi:hypothetical protein